MSLKAFLTSKMKLNLYIRNVLIHRSYATYSDTAKVEPIDITSVDNRPTFVEDNKVDDQSIAAMRNKSRLNPAHRNILNGRRPYKGSDMAWYHETRTYQHKMLGRFGIESGVPPGIAWPTKKKIAELKEYEKVAYPLTIQESLVDIAAKRKAEEEKIKAREDNIAVKLSKTKQWENELKSKLAKKQAEIQAARDRRERLVEEVRRHFGFKVDPRDEKFKEMIGQKEKEDNKRRKDAKKKEKAERLMAQLLQIPSSKKEGSSDTEKNKNAETELPTNLT